MKGTVCLLLVCSSIFTLLPSLSVAAPVASTKNEDVPFMCAHVIGRLADQAAIQTSACSQGMDCNVNYTVRARAENAPLANFRSVNWTSTVISTSTLDCKECNEAMSMLNFMCHVSSPEMGDRRSDFASACATLRPHDEDMFRKCKLVFDTVSSLFCPRDPCQDILRSVQFSPNAVCQAAPLDCAQTRNTAPPEKAQYDKPDFAPLHLIPPLSCSVYVQSFQKICVDSTPQWQACTSYDGFRRSGCEWLIRRVLLASATPGDMCQPLFFSQQNSTTQDQQAKATKQAVSPIDVCTSLLQLPDQSPLPFEEYLNYRNHVVNTPTATPTPTIVPLEVAATPTPTPVPEGDTPCVEANTPSPTPAAIVRLWPKPIGYHIRMTNAPLISFSCPATSTWTEVVPKLGCHFAPFYIKYAGFGETDRNHPCSCTCSGQVPECREGTVVYWSDVRSAETCAQMMCSRKRFHQCSFKGSEVSRDGAWNGDNVKFTSVALQETCAGAAASVNDLCGTVITSAMLHHVTHLMTWTITTAQGVSLSSDSGVDRDESKVGVSSVWLPCGGYQLVLEDNSFEGGGWARGSLELKNQAGYKVVSVGNVESSNLHRTSVSFQVSAEALQSAMSGLCHQCQSEPQPCKYPATDPELPELCVPFAEGTQECPPNTVRCQ
eukprot:c10514_g1_i1.p1 GENE.c10514_g1_i1~~c10514_g1_i1.p1  ORF type:complete len:661 (-),score=155.26 c10514_g1_i1:133-2115(-)